MNFNLEELELVDLCLLALSITPTARATKRNWSLHGLIYLLKRNRLDYNTVIKLVFLHWNLRIKLQELVPKEDVKVPFDINVDDKVAYRPDYLKSIRSI